MASPSCCGYGFCFVVVVSFAKLCGFGFGFGVAVGFAKPMRPKQACYEPGRLGLAGLLGFLI